MTKGEFGEILAIIGGAKMKFMDARTMDVWWNLARTRDDVPLDAWRAGAIKLASTAGDWPTFDKLLAEAVEHIHGLDEQAGEAWERIRKASREWYPGDAEQCRLAESMLTPKELAIVNQMGGFRTFQEMTIENRPIVFGQFQKVWNANRDQDKRMKQLPEAVRPKLALLETERLAKKLSVQE